MSRAQLARIRFHAWAGVCVHGKVTIIDDIWCAVGSANCMRRSFHTDLELSVGIVTAQIGFTRFEAIMPDIGGTRSP